MNCYIEPEKICSSITSLIMKVSIFSLLSFLLLFFIGCSSEPQDPNNETNARVMVWNFVERKLKDPGSAKFGLCELNKTTTGTWITDCYVDAKNSFGGGERLYFVCEVKHKEGDSWELVQLSFK
jgi:hypothetical protein